ncbi:hypothetical protein ACVGOW_01680 [Pseudonocardia saturnea]
MPTFVLRLQTPELPLAATIPLRGVVVDIATGASGTVSGAAELVALLTAAIRATAERGPVPHGDRR